LYLENRIPNKDQKYQSLQERDNKTSEAGTKSSGRKKKQTKNRPVHATLGMEASEEDTG